MKTRLLILFMTFSSAFANAGDKKFFNLKEPKENKNSLTLSFANGLTSAAFISRLFSLTTNGYWSDVKKVLIRPEIALPETVLATASALVDVKPSTANTVIGYGNIIWGSVKLLAYLSSSLTNSVTTALFLSTIATNGVNAVYRLWYAKKAD